ncbi:glycosyltransferase family 4 protein [bacterium]|nr:glycosyltransferase family 4 protein [bacterium]
MVRPREVRFEDYVLFQGNRHHPGSFKLINDRLLEALERARVPFVTMASDVFLERPGSLPAKPPQLYVYHGWPQDLESAPGRKNLFILNYEYSQPRPSERNLILRLNERFDAVMVPSCFIRDMLLRAGLKIPVEVIPWGVDALEFSPSDPEVEGPFTFLYLGAANPRKGFDLVLKAFHQEFRADEPVRLIVKESYRMQHRHDWIERIATSVGLDWLSATRLRPGPEVIWVHGFEESVAHYCRQADAGVFPFRGEGFGLGILECLACGTPVIVTRGTGPMDFCNHTNASFISAQTRGLHLEPDLDELRRLMRESFLRGRPGPQKRREVAASVGAYGWERTLQSFLDLIGRLRKQTDAGLGSEAFPCVGYHYARKGLVSWTRLCAWYERTLSKRHTNFTSANRNQLFPRRDYDLLVGQSEHCLESFLRAPNSRRILHLETTVLQARLDVTNRERKLCEVPLLSKRPIEFWRNRLECELADRIVVPSKPTLRLFLQAGFQPHQLRVIPYGIVRAGRPRPAPGGKKIRYLFVATDPFRKGVRLLFAAWDRLRLPGAELLCVPGREILYSRPLLKLLTRNPSIILADALPYRELLKLYDTVHCQLLPSLEDSFSLSVADGLARGVPAIVSNETGICDILTSGFDGWVVQAGSQEQLEQALLESYEDRLACQQRGLAAYETSRKYPWRHFRNKLLELTEELIRDP